MLDSSRSKNYNYNCKVQEVRTSTKGGRFVNIINLKILEEIRKQKYLKNKLFTQEYIAKQIGYKSKSAYNNIVKGKVKITLEISLRIKKALNLTQKEYKEIFFANEVQDVRT